MNLTLDLVDQSKKGGVTWRDNPISKDLKIDLKSKIIVCQKLYNSLRFENMLIFRKITELKFNYLWQKKLKIK